MNTTKNPNQDKPWRARPVHLSRTVFLLFAVMLHAALLLIPLHQAESPLARQTLEVDLWVQQLVEDAARIPEPEPEHPPEPKPPEPPPDELKDQPREAAVESAPAAADARTGPAITAAFLIDAVSRMKWEEPKAHQRTLGVAVHRELPSNVAGRVMPLTPNWFDDSIVPSSVKIVDRWQESDGTMMVVLRTPTGHTLCGRGAAWDAMNPLVEHVMMFNTCGGGGPRVKPPRRKFPRGG
jgi:hypothetical protein